MKAIEALEITFQVLGVTYRVYSENTLMNPEHVRDQIILIWDTAHLYSVKYMPSVDAQLVKKYNILTALKPENLGHAQ